jgi:hypothetical protein
VRAVARRFQQVAWPAFALLLVTGIWNLAAVHVGDTSTEYRVTLFVKLVLVGISGGAAFGHVIATRTAAKGALAGLALLTALAATLLGVLLRTSA